jgi:hypothetical protein
MRVGSRITLLISASLAAAGLLAGGATPAHAITNQKVKKLLERELKERGYDGVGASGCNSNHSRYICQWHAEGIGPGQVPYKCRQKAKFRTKKRTWKIPKCRNRLPAEIPLLSEPGPHPTFGYNEGWLQHDGELDELEESGADAARQGLYWSAIERSPGSYDWRPFDAVYQNMLAQGIRPLWVLFEAPCWAQGKPSGCNPTKRYRPTSAHYGDFAHFAALAAQRYPLALGIEVWNEPNTELFWGGKPEPAEYASMLKQVAPAVQAANPDMPVISGGLASSYTTDKNSLSTVKFLRKIYKKGAAQAADAIGIHAYPKKAYHQDFIGSIRIRLAKSQRVKRKRGEGEKPIWITEIGVSTTGKQAYTPDHQANALAQIYNLFRRVDAPIPVLIFHRFVDVPTSGLSAEAGYGVLNKQGNRKPAYCAVAKARDAPC